MSLGVHLKEVQDLCILKYGGTRITHDAVQKILNIPLDTSMDNLMPGDAPLPAPEAPTANVN